MADAGQFRKVRSIIEADPARKVIVVSAAGKRFKDDHKLTDLLYLCHAHKKYGVSCDPVFDMIADRYREICAELGLSVDIDSELIQCLCLRYGSRKAVKDKSVFAIVHFKTILYYPDDDIVGNELACLDSSLSFEAHFGAVLHCLADDISG